jgi:hypothetical protein
LAKRLKSEPGVWEAFSELVSCGADPDELGDGMAGVRFNSNLYDPNRKPIVKPFVLSTPESDSQWGAMGFRPETFLHRSVEVPRFTFEGLIGIGRKEIPTVVKRLQQCARDVRRLRLRNIILHLDPRHDRRLLDWGSSLPFPFYCEALAESLDRVQVAYRQRRRPSYDEAIANLVRYVQESTGKPRDEQVATLIGFAIDNCEYDAAALKTWRTKHADLVSPRKK